MSPNFSQDFMLYTFASDHSYTVVLTQKKAGNNEVPITFMSSAFKGVELYYLVFAPNSSPGEKIEGAYMPCWVLQSMTAVEERVRGNKTNYKQELNKNKLKL